MSIYLRLYKLVFKYRKGVALAWLCVFGAAGFQLVSPQLVQWAIDNGITKAQAQRYLLLLAAAGIFGAAACRSMAQYGRQYLGQVLGQKVAYDLRNGIYNRLQHLSFAYHDSHQTGQLMSRATQDVEAVQQFVQMGVLHGGLFRGFHQGRAHPDVHQQLAAGSDNIAISSVHRIKFGVL